MTDLICIDASPALFRPSSQRLRYLARYAVERSRPTAICGRCMQPACNLFQVHGVVGEWCERRFVRAPPAEQKIVTITTWVRRPEPVT